MVKNKTAYYVRNKKSFEIREDDLGEIPTPYHVLIRNKWVGICGSDINALELDFFDEIVLGHEWVGEVLEVGSLVTGLSKGDFVTSSNKIKCGYCSSCQGQEKECENLQWLTANYGMFKEFAYLPAVSLVKLAGEVSQNSTLFEIIAVAENVWEKMHSIFKNNSGKVLIMGGGLLGLSMGLVLQREGVEFEMLEVIHSRIDRGRKLGFKCHHLAELLMDSQSKDAFSCIVDATGDHLAGPGGWKYLEHFGAKDFTGIILAKYINDIPFKTFRFFSKQANLCWVQGCTNKSLMKAIDSWKDTINELAQTLITHNFTLDEIEKAFETAKDRKVSGRVIVSI